MGKQVVRLHDGPIGVTHYQNNWHLDDLNFASSALVSYRLDLPYPREELSGSFRILCQANLPAASDGNSVGIGSINVDRIVEAPFEGSVDGLIDLSPLYAESITFLVFAQQLQGVLPGQSMSLNLGVVLVD